MKLSEICVRRPVLTIVITLLPILIGLVLYTFTPIKFSPPLGSKAVTINVSASQLGARQINQQVLRPILTVLGIVKGVEHTYATASNTKGTIQLLLNHDADLDNVVTQTNNQITTIRDDLPMGVTTTVTKGAGASSLPQAVLVTSAPKMSEANFFIYYKNHYLPLINHITSVGTTTTLPDNYDNMIIALAPQALAYYHLTISNVLSQLNAAIANEPSWGNAAGNLGKTALYLGGQLSTLKSLNALPIQLSSEHGSTKSTPTTIPLKNLVSSIHMGQPLSSSISTAGPPIVNFKPRQNTLISLIYQSDAKGSNLLELSSRLHALTKQKNSGGVKASLLIDFSTYLNKVIDSVLVAIIIAFILVAIIIYSFLGKLTTALIPMVTVPTCLITSFIIIYVLGFSINIFTLLAILLAVGLVVDDAIVLIECIDKNLETNNNPRQATHSAIKQIGFPLISMSLTLAAVYVPMAFTTSIMGPALQQFAIVLAGSVLISAFVALTLTPMMAARMMSASHGKLSLFVGSRLQKVITVYERMLHFVLAKKWLFLGLILFIALSGMFAFKEIPGGLVTEEDSGFMVVNAMFHGSSISGSYLRKEYALFDAVMKKFKPKIKNIITVAQGGQKGLAVLSLKDDVTSAIGPKIETALRSTLRYPSTSMVSPVKPESVFQESENTVNLILQSPDGQDLVNTGHNLGKALDRYSEVEYAKVGADLPGEGLETYIINNQLAKQYGVKISQIHDIVNTAMGTTLLNHQLIMPIYNPKVYVQLPNAYFDSPEKLYDMNVDNNVGKWISVRSLGSFQFEWRPNHFFTWDNVNSNEVQVTFKQYSYVQGLQFLNHVLPKILPQGITYNYVGQAGTYVQDQTSQLFLFIAAFLFIYLILSAQFESFIDAFIIICSLPITLCLALWPIFIARIDLNIYTQMGLLTLMGLTCKNGILITEFANQLCAEGKDKLTAVIAAAKLRFRPIVMTSLTMIMGSIPLIIADKAIKHMMFDVGYVIFTGMILGTLSSLFTVPLVYLLLKRDNNSSSIKDAITH